jgi:hypothetical protein
MNPTVSQLIAHPVEKSDIYMFSLPAGYFHSADPYLIGKHNLKPGIELILRVKIVGVRPGPFSVYGKLWSILLS